MNDQRPGPSLKSALWHGTDEKFFFNDSAILVFGTTYVLQTGEVEHADSRRTFMVPNNIGYEEYRRVNLTIYIS